MLAVAGACDHTTPAEYEPPEGLPPFSDELPRRLTFNPGDDRHPSVSGGVLAFSRFELGQTRYSELGFGAGERWIALLPPEGGTIMAIHKPPPPPAPEDSVVTLVEPVVSPDGTQIAYVWEKSGLISVVTSNRELRVAPCEDPAEVQFSWDASWRLPDGRLANHVIKPSWLGTTTIRFLTGVDSVFKVKGGGASRYTDTVAVAYALVELDLTTGDRVIVPGAGSAIAYAPAPDGGTWIVAQSDSARLLHLAPGSAVPAEVGFFSAAVEDLAAVEGVPVAVAAGRIEALDPVTGAQIATYRFRGPARRVSSVPGTRRFVAQVERASEPFGASANLWLLRLP
jgi:hypothetical protein